MAHSPRQFFSHVPVNILVTPSAIHFLPLSWLCLDPTSLNTPALNSDLPFFPHVCLQSLLNLNVPYHRVPQYSNFYFSGYICYNNFSLESCWFIGTRLWYLRKQKGQVISVSQNIIELIT